MTTTRNAHRVNDSGTFSDPFSAPGQGDLRAGRRRVRNAPICLSVVATALTDAEVAARFTRATEILMAVDARCRREEAMNLGSGNNGNIPNAENVHK